MKRFLILIALAVMPTAHGAIVSSGLLNISVPYTFDGVYVNIDTQLTSFSPPVDFDAAPWINLDFGGVDIVNGDNLRPVITGPDVVLNLTLLTLVDGGSTFAPGGSASSTHMGPAPGQFQANVPGYFGFQFSFAPAGPVHYGWAEITTNDTGGPGVIHQWAYENVANTGILVGVVPEPGGTVLLVLTATGLAVRRRRSQAPRC